jgi:single-stranded-DNA-specific exonuclease
VTRGIEQIRNAAVPGLGALIEVGRLNGPVEPYHLGFVLGPRVNAGGRVGRCDLGSQLLATDSPEEAIALARELDILNQERRSIEQGMVEEAISLVESDAGLRACAVLVVAHEGWHPGVIGIIASRLKERYAKPAIVISLNEGVGKGSGRSVTGVDLGTAIVAAKEQGLLINGGGHAMAAGLTIDPGRVLEFRAFLSAQLASACAASPEGRELVIDGALSPGGATEEFCTLVSRCGPYGSGNAEPVFAFPSLAVSYVSVVGEQHVRCAFQSADGARLNGIAFRAMQSELGAVLLKHKGRRLHVAATLKVDEWQGQRRVQATIRDAALAS